MFFREWFSGWLLKYLLVPTNISLIKEDDHPQFSTLKLSRHWRLTSSICRRGWNEHKGALGRQFTLTKVLVRWLNHVCSLKPFRAMCPASHSLFSGVWSPSPSSPCEQLLDVHRRLPCRTTLLLFSVFRPTLFLIYSTFRQTCLFNYCNVMIMRHDPLILTLTLIPFYSTILKSVSS